MIQDAINLIVAKKLDGVDVGDLVGFGVARVDLTKAFREFIHHFR